MERGRIVDANSQISFDFGLFIVGVVVVVVVSTLVVFIAGYLTGSVRTRRMMESINAMKKERQLRKIIRMQAAPRPRRSSPYITGYYPGAQARRNQAKYRRARREQTRMRGK